MSDEGADAGSPLHSSPPEVTVHVVDDDEPVRESILFLLSMRGLPARGHASADAFLAALPAQPAGCLVTDIRMPGTDGIELLRTLRARGIRLPVLVMTGHADVPMAVEAMKLGAIDFVEKPFSDEVLVAGVRAALDKDREEAVRYAAFDAARARLEVLTARERQILSLVADGKSSKIIAHELGLSPRTVEVHRANIMAKTDTVNASDLSSLYRLATAFGTERG